jgi:membrane protein required for colicin V production
MGLESNLDVFLISVLLLTSLIGLIRGFLKEIASIVGWFGSMYLTSVLKPYAIMLFPQDFRFPFLIDIITNSALFITLMISLSIISKMAIDKLKSFIPLSVNSGLGFLFGFFKGVLIISLVLTCLNVVYKDKKPDFLSKSIINKIVDKNAETFTKVINSLLGNFIKENIADTEKNNEEKDIETTPKRDDNPAVDMITKSKTLKDLLEDETQKNVPNKDKIDKPNKETDLDKLINIFVE